MSNDSGAARRLDHVVMPVASLEASRAFFEALGFFVAPDAVHPFGTKNACIFFAAGPYIEPLAIASSDTVEAEAASGTVFVAHDAAYRFRRGVPGYSALALGSGDAKADLAGFATAGIADGPLFGFSRRLTVPGGASRDLTFRLAFASDRRATDIRVFVCELVGAPADRSALTRHRNGALGIVRTVLSEPKPAEFQVFLQQATGSPDILRTSAGLSVETPNGTIDVLTPDALLRDYGAARESERGLRIEGIVVAVPDLDAVRAIAEERGAELDNVAGRLIARLAPNTSAFVAFEERISP